MYNNHPTSHFPCSHIFQWFWTVVYYNIFYRTAPNIKIRTYHLFVFCINQIFSIRPVNSHLFYKLKVFYIDQNVSIISRKNYQNIRSPVWTEMFKHCFYDTFLLLLRFRFIPVRTAGTIILNRQRRSIIWSLLSKLLKYLLKIKLQ